MTAPMTRTMSALAVALLFAGNAAAHDTWLSLAPTTDPTHSPASPRSGDTPPAGTAPTAALRLTSGHRFPAPGTAVQADRLRATRCDTPTGPAELRPGAVDAQALSLTLPSPPSPGLSCRVAIAPRTIALDAKQVAQYLDEIRASSALRREWAALPAPRVWRETYAKTAVWVMAGADGRLGTIEAGGQGLEFSITPAPSAATPPRVRVLRDGQPVAGLPVEAVGPRGRSLGWRTSDANVFVSLAPPATGDWMLRAVDLRRGSGGEATWQSHFATLVVQRAAR